MVEQPFGELRTRSPVAVRDSAHRGKLVATVPFMAFEVHDRGVVVTSDPGFLPRVRHLLTMVLEPVTRPIPFIMGDRIGRQAPDAWIMPWDGIAGANQGTRWCLTLKTSHGSARTFRFRSRRGLQVTLDELRAHGVAVDCTRHRS